MKRVNFYYSTKLTFDDYVHDHSFALRIIPPETDTQKIVFCGLNISPYVSTQQTVDAFGNNVTSGYLKGDHRFLDFEIKGSAETDCTKHRLDLLPCYFYQSKYTQPDEGLKAFYNEIKSRCTGLRRVKPRRVAKKTPSTSLILEASRNWMALRMLS